MQVCEPDAGVYEQELKGHTDGLKPMHVLYEDSNPAPYSRKISPQLELGQGLIIGLLSCAFPAVMLQLCTVLSTCSKIQTRPC